MSSPFTPAWASFSDEATRLLPNPLVSRDALSTRARELLAARMARPISPEVLACLRAQEAQRPQSDARTQNLERLEKGALVVATGQQVGLFLGPLYALHKAATAIAWARELERILEHPVVPLFWLQTEDADFDEVKTAYLPGPEGLVAAALTPGDTLDGQPLDEGARVSLGHRRIGPSIDEALATAKTLLSGPHAADTLALLERAYRPDRTLGQAAGDLMAELFADFGLLVFDPRPTHVPAAPAPAATAPFKDTLRFALDTHDRIEATLRDRASAIEQAGFDVQVKVRERTSLVCLHPDGPCSGRFRLVHANGMWTLAGGAGELTGAEVSARLDTPHHLSTTALLRPILQDQLFPTIAYVGGPGEIAYFAQLPPLYELAGVPMPLVLPRARLMLSTPALRRLTEQLGLPADAWRLDTDAIRARALAARADLGQAEGALDTWRDATANALFAMNQAATALGDPTFAKHADKAKDQIEQTMARTLERLKRVALDRDTETRHRLERLLALTRPHGGPQERALCFPTFAAQLGPTALCHRLVAEVDTLVQNRALGDVLEVAL